MCLRPQCERHSVAKPLCVSSLRCYKKGGGLKTLSAEQSCLLDQPVETQACRGRDRAQGSSIVRRERTNSRGKTTSSQTGLPSNKCPTQGFQAVACFEDPERCPRTLLSPYLAPHLWSYLCLEPSDFLKKAGFPESGWPHHQTPRAGTWTTTEMSIQRWGGGNRVPPQPWKGIPARSSKYAPGRVARS